MDDRTATLDHRHPALAAAAGRHGQPAFLAAVAVALGGVATILGALYFQYGLGIVPCPLCLEQRRAYYVAIPLAVVVAIAAKRQTPRPLLLAGLGLLALALLVGAGIAAYHSGVEWKWWPGPLDCSGPLNPLGARDLLSQLQTVSIVRCDEAPWRFLGLSLAGYNALISLFLAAIAAWGIAAQVGQASSRS